MANTDSRVTIHMAASLDGFIARKDGSVDWLETSDEFVGGDTMDPGFVEAFLKTIDCYVMGSRTYETALSFEAKGLGSSYGDKPTFVLTRRDLLRTRDTVEFYSGDLAQLVNERLRPTFRTIWFVGGGVVSGECLRLGLADEVRYSILPILIGDGTRLILFLMICYTVMVLISALFLLIRSLIISRTALAAENLAMRQQLSLLNRKINRPQLRRRDRFFWVILSQLWKNWREALIIVKPETVIKWHRQGFRLYWRWKSQAPVGRPKIDKEIRELIGKMSRENPLWGVPRLQAELHLLGYDLAESTVAKYRVRSRTSPSQTWKIFLANHAKQIAAVDFFTVPTITFRNLYCFVVLLHDRRQVIHFNVTAHPTAAWTAQQIVEAFPEDTASRYLLRDRDQIYGEEFRRRVAGMQIGEVPTAPRSPFQNPYAERVIGSIRRECLDHLIIIGEDHLRRILRYYIDYYHNSRPHQALERNSPIPREIEAPAKGKIISIPQVGGLHHRYR